MSVEQKELPWGSMVEELQKKCTLEFIAEHVGVSERQVRHWKAGDKPKGMNAVKLYLLHWRQCRPQAAPEELCSTGN